MRQQCASREILRSAARLQGSTVFIAPSSLGPFEKNDLGMFLQDAGLLVRLGVRVFLAEEVGATFWDDQDLAPGLQRIHVQGHKGLIRAAAERSSTKLLLLSGADHIITSRGHRLDDVPIAEARRLLAEQELVTEVSKETLRLAISACESGIPRVHIFNVHRDGALLDELCTDFGAGTMIHTDPRHKEVRPMGPAERFGVCTLLREVLPRRTAEFVREHERELRVFTVDGDVHGVARITPSEDALVVRTIAHSPRANAADVISALLRGIVDEAREQRMTQVCLPVDELPARMRLLPWFQELKFAKGRAVVGGSTQEVWLKAVA